MKVNITIGRFQPFTQGHLNMILEGGAPCIIYRINSSDRDPLKIKGKKIPKSEIDRVVAYVNGDNINLTEREKELLKRPFSNEFIEKELDIVKKNYKNNIIDIIYIKNAYEALEDFEKKVESGEYEPQYLMCGDDRIDSYIGMINRVPGLSGKLEPNKGLGRSKGVSGSLVRQAIIQNDRSAFERMMPKGTGVMFDEFRKSFQGFVQNLQKLLQENYRSLRSFLTENLRSIARRIDEGGAAGHMAHPYDYDEMTGQDICDLIGTLFSGRMENVKEKLDGTNIYATMNRNGDVVFIRNKGDLNSELGGMTLQDMADKWKDKPETQRTFLTAGNIITRIFKKLGYTYFNPDENTRKVINCECIVAGKTNVMFYAEDRVAFHGYVLYKKIDGEWKEDKKVEGHVEDIYNIAQDSSAEPRPDIIIKSTEEALKEKDRFIKSVKDMFEKEGLGLNNTIEDWKRVRFNELKPEWMTEVVDDIYNRWFNGDKSFKASELKRLYPDHYEDVKSDKFAKKYVGEVIEPMDELFIDLGSAFIGLCQGFINAGSENEIIQTLKSDMEDAMKELEKSDDPDILQKTAIQIKRIRDKCLNATEGVVFTYKGKLMKLTGTFAALNQIIGMKYRI